MAYGARNEYPAMVVTFTPGGQAEQWAWTVRRGVRPAG